MFELMRNRIESRGIHLFYNRISWPSIHISMEFLHPHCSPASPCRLSIHTYCGNFVFQPIVNNDLVSYLENSCIS